ncbi:MAG: polyprenyl synthetase family protein [Candidatus Edwardsbacteria bacterium]|nr:polyprenyl synthetase family protein [Candidatus Edwardsbacteria bacterium]
MAAKRKAGKPAASRKAKRSPAKRSAAGPAAKARGNPELALLLDEVARRRELVRGYLARKDRPERFRPDDIYRGVHSYLEAGGKALRAAVLLFSCGAVGGDEDKALPAAAAVEVYHAWTLVHDDIIDRDALRRGVPTVHEEIRQRAAKKLGLKAAEAAHYGVSMAILAGDLQQGWTISLLTELAREKGVNPILVLQLILDLEVDVQCALIEGEALDLLYSKLPLESLSEEKILDMLGKKTGALYQFAGKTGAMIGLDQPNARHPSVDALAQFAANCGIAFQLQDDILGILGDEKKLGKPVGSDIREGKRTTIVFRALKDAGRGDRAFLLRTLGNPGATAAQVKRAKDLLVRLGGVDYTIDLAEKHVKRALAALEPLPDSDHKRLLLAWANYMVKREY